MKIGSIIGSAMLSVGLLWLPITGAILFNTISLWPVCAGIVLCIIVGAYLLWTNGPSQDEIDEMNIEEAKALERNK